jgi:hypothetical protein
MDPQLVAMLKKGHEGMSSDMAEAALVAWSQWIEERRATLLHSDPQALVALWKELSMEEQ